MPNIEFHVNSTRLDPYKTYRFRVKWDGRYVAGVSKVSGLTRKTELVKHREGGSPSMHLSSRLTSYPAITLERGVTHDVEFENWANEVWNRSNAGNPGSDAASGNENSLKDFRKDIILELYNEADQKVLAYNIYRCWVSEYTALPDLDANAGNTVAIQMIKLENEGWERDTSGAEPGEPGG